MWVRAKDELTKPKCNKVRMTDNIAFPVIPFLNLASTTSFSVDSSILPRSTSPRIGNNSWFATSSKVTVISPQERKKGMGGATLSVDQMTEIEISPYSWISNKMKQWPSACLLAVTPP